VLRFPPRGLFQVVQTGPFPVHVADADRRCRHKRVVTFRYPCFFLRELVRPVAFFGRPQLPELLLLRGEQTEGDLRGRASRMDPIPDLDTLRVHLDRLAERGLVIWLSPPGRGRMLTHGLLPEEKLEKVRRELGLAMAAAAQAAPAADASIDDEPELNKPAVVAERAAPTPPPVAPGPSTEEFERRIADLEREVAALHARLKALEDALG
jgi:uncharacterized protein YceH (UPF0502 family)